MAEPLPRLPVHVGGDECPTTEWPSHRPGEGRDGTGTGSTDPRAAPGPLHERDGPAARERGREVLAWDEVLEADAPADVVVVAWRAAERGAAAARAGHDVVMAPMDWLYFDWVSSDAESEPPAQTAAPDCDHLGEGVRVPGACPRASRPRPPRASAAPRPSCGPSTSRRATTWTTWPFPRLCAFAEAAWGTAGDAGEFRSRLGTHLARLGAKGLKYRPLDA